MDTFPPVETPPPSDVSPPPKKSRKLWYIVGAVVVVLFVVPGIIALVMSATSKPASQNNNQSSLKDVALADDAKIDAHHLPAGKTLFFTMMQRTAEQKTIAGMYGEGDYSDPDQPGKPVTRTYQLRADTWASGKVSFDYADVPWNPADQVVELQRCLNGTNTIYASSKPEAGWQAQAADTSKLECTNNADSVAAGKTAVDGLLTGGLSKNQAIVWVDVVAAAKDSGSGTPLFSFGTPTLTSLDGKQVIGLSYTINSIKDRSLCTTFCGPGALQDALKKAQVDPITNGYSVDGLSDSAKGMYYIDPSTLLPVQSQMTTYSLGDASTEYRRQFRYAKPDMNHTPTAKATAVPLLIQGFVDISHTGLTGPSPQ